MNRADISNALQELGHTVSFVTTGHADYVRGFVLDKEGVTLGRITVYQGEYDHIKWYWRGHGGLCESDYIIFAWRHFLDTGKVLTRERYDGLIHQAEELQQADYDRKVQWRRDNLYTGNGRRRRLQRRNIRMFMGELLEKQANG